MSGLEHKARGPGAAQSDNPESLALASEREIKVRPAGGHRMRENTPRRGIPRWRQIEIMRERQQLRRLLDDFGDDDVQFDEEIFNFGQNSEGLYDAVSDADVEDPELDGEAFYEEQ